MPSPAPDWMLRGGTSGTFSEAEEAEALLSPREARVSVSTRRTPRVAIVTALIASLLVLAGVYALRSGTVGVVVRNSLGKEVTELRSKACSEYPYLKFDMDHPVLHSNLGRRGPDAGAEGIVYDTIDLGEGAGMELGHQVLMVVNATSSSYKPFSTRWNGMQGKYGSINLKSGSSVDLLFHFYDRRSGDPYTLPEAAWTFFDLDTGSNGHSVESVTFHKVYKNYHLTQNTEVRVEDLGHRTKFSGSTFGNGDDNPRDPMRLTQQQKNRAVTLTFENLSELRVTLSASPGKNPRFFTFVSRPSLMCALTVQDGFRPPLNDIIAQPPLQQSVQSDYDIPETFGALLVAPNEKVSAGDPVFTTRQPDGSMKTYVSPIDGTVVSAQTQLESGEDMHMRLDNKTIVIVERGTLDSLVIKWPYIIPGGPAHRDGEDGGHGKGFYGSPIPDDLVGYWCGPGCTGGPRSGGGASGGAQPFPQISKDATFVEYLKQPGEPVSEGEPIMRVKDGDKLVAVTSPELGVVKSREEGMQPGTTIPPPGPFALLDIRPEVTADAQFIQYLKAVGDPVAKGDPLMKVKNVWGEEVIIKAKTVGVVKAIQEDIKEGDPIAVAEDQNLMTIGPIPALPTGAEGFKSGIVHKRGQELVAIKVKPGDLIQKGDVVAVVRDPNTGKESEVLSDHDGLVTGVNDKLKPGDPIDRTEDGNLMTTGKFAPLPVEPPREWPSDTDKAGAGPGARFVKYHVKPGDHVEAGDPIATVRRADGVQVPVKADRAGVVMRIQEALRPGMALDDVMQDKNLATIRKTDKLPPLPLNPVDEWPSNNEEEENGPGCKFVKYHVKPGDRVSTGDPIATVQKPDGTLVDILAARPGIVKATQGGLKPGMNLDDTMEDDNLATIGKLPPLDVDPGEAGCCTPGEDKCPSGAPKVPFPLTGAGVGPAGTGPSAFGPVGAGNPQYQAPGGQQPLSSPLDRGPWAFEKWSAEVDDAVEKGDPIAIVKNTRTGEEKAVLASKDGNVMRRQEALREGDVIDHVMEDTDLAVIGKFNPLHIGLTERGISAPMDAIFVKWYHLVGEHVDSSDNVAQVRLGVPTAGGRRLMTDIDIPSPGTGTIVEEMDLKPGQSIGQQSLGPEIAKLDVGFPWWLLALALLLLLLLCLLCCLALVCRRKPKPSHTALPVGELESPPPVIVVDEEPHPDGLRLDFQDEGVIRTVYARFRPLGIKHNFVAPIIAHDFTLNSYAKQELGVKDGWKLRRIGDEELHDNPNFEEVNNKLSEYMKDFPLWPLPIEFAEERDGGERKTFMFVERPIGIEFKNRAPIEVEKVFEGSPADDACVKVGWHVTKIGEFEVTETTTFHEVMAAIREGVTPLDDYGKEYPTQNSSY